MFPADIIAAHYYFTLQKWDQLALLNDIPFIPTEMLVIYDIYPIIHQDWEDTYSMVKTLISRADMESGKTKVVKLLDDESLV